MAVAVTACVTRVCISLRLIGLAGAGFLHKDRHLGGFVSDVVVGTDVRHAWHRCEQRLVGAHLRGKGGLHTLGKRRCERGDGAVNVGSCHHRIGAGVLSTSEGGGVLHEHIHPATRAVDVSCPDVARWSDWHGTGNNGCLSICW